MAKLKITPLWKSNGGVKVIKVPFNPTQYSISKSVTWNSMQKTSRVGAAATPTEGTTVKLNAPQLEFGGGDSRTLTLNLFFDVTEKPDGVKDVRALTNQFVVLTLKERTDDKNSEPPICRIEWGEKGPENSDFPFEGVITSLNQTFTLFNSEGTPVRATLAVVFKEQINTAQDQRKTDPDFTTHTVKRGDSLSSIASSLYKDPTKWRVIADANNLDDPRHLRIGATLSIPKIG
jgi:nucleoid-associated protein YgaU